LWKLGRRDEAIATWSVAVKENVGLPLANSFLRGASADVGLLDAATSYQKQADQYTPKRSAFSLDVGPEAAKCRDDGSCGSSLQSSDRTEPRIQTRR
jgi:hypothetical protein